MTLIVMRAWDGPSSEMTRAGKGREPRYGYDSFVTSLSLVDALRRIREYEDAFNAWAPETAVNFTLHAVSAIPAIDPETARVVRARVVEGLDETIRLYREECAARPPGYRDAIGKERR